MEKDFLGKVKQTQEMSTMIETENGALGYLTSGSKFLDVLFSISSLRFASDVDIISAFDTCYKLDRVNTLKFMFFIGDVRGGLGERKIFSTWLNRLIDVDFEMALRVLDLIPYYTRYDHLIKLIDCGDKVIEECVFNIVKDTLYADLDKVDKGKNGVSLLGKWMPSINTSSIDTRVMAKKWMALLGMTPAKYRKTLSKLRRHLDIVECKMCANDWGNINYSAVPSKANLKYRSAFLNHDYDRRSEFLNSVMCGAQKINAGVLYPHEIVSKVIREEYGAYDSTSLEALWKALPDYVQGDDSTLCVMDGSGSMYTSISDGTQAIDVAVALTLYFSGKATGQFKDKFITFSRRPEIVDLSEFTDLESKCAEAMRHNAIENTNVEAVFNLILDTAAEYGLKQEDLPKNILILSDMEFDRTAKDSKGNSFNGALFDQIKSDYEQAGYKLPRLVFWNITSRTLGIPLRENDMGVMLVSGFSPSIMDMVLSNSLDPVKCLMGKLNSERYAVIDERLS